MAAQQTEKQEPQKQENMEQRKEQQQDKSEQMQGIQVSKPYHFRIKGVSKAFGSVLESGESRGRSVIPSLPPSSRPVPGAAFFHASDWLPVMMGKFWKKVCKKFGKGGKIALSLHPLKRNEGDETRGRQVQVVAAFWRCWRRSFPAEPFKRGTRKKSLKKLRKRFGGNDKNALSLHPLSLLKKRRRWRWQEEFFNNIDVKITT